MEIPLPVASLGEYRQEDSDVSALSALIVNARGGRLMFSVEHGFDATVITLVDEGDGGTLPGEDVVVSAFEECITLTQVDARSGEPVTITLSMGQARDLAAALNLPEGVYRR